MKIRLAVAVQENGNWQCAGWRDATDQQMRQTALDCLDPCDHEVVHYIEVDVPMPFSQTFEGTVVPQNPGENQGEIEFSTDKKLDHRVDDLVRQYYQDNPKSKVVEWELAEIIR
jgi:hypothetical protein